MNVKNIVIRKREQKDCFDIAHVVTIAWQETYRGLVNDEFLDNLPNTEKERGKKSYDNFNLENNHQFVLEVDGKVVGFVKVGITEDLEYKDQGEVYALYIIAKFKGNGYGRKLIEAGIKELKNMKCKDMLIGCLKGNPSNNFYKHIGGKYIKTKVFKLPNQDLIENVYYFKNI